MRSCTSNTSSPSLPPMTDEQERLVEENLSLVYWVVLNQFKRALKTEEARDELVCVGNVALVRAARDYDPNRGAFSTIAAKYIQNSLYRFLRDNTSDIHLPAYKQKGMTADEMNMYRCVRLDAVLAKCDMDSDDHLEALRDKAVDIEGYVSLKADVEKILNEMTDRRREIMMACLTTEDTLTAIAARYGVSMQRVGQIKREFQSKVLELNKDKRRKKK